MKHNIGEWRSKAIERFNSRGKTGGGRPINLCESDEMIIELLANNRLLGRGSEKLNLKEVGDFLESRKKNESDSEDESSESDSNSSSSSDGGSDNEDVNDDDNDDDVLDDETLPITKPSTSTRKPSKKRSTPALPNSKGMFF